VNILQQISSILPACGPKRTNFYASKTPIDPHFVPNSLKIIDCVTSLGRTELKGTHPLKQWSVFGLSIGAKLVFLASGLLIGFWVVHRWTEPAQRRESQPGQKA